VTHRALVTGGNGFVAQWAMRAMLARGWEVTAAGIGALPASRVLGAEERARVRWRELDVTSQPQVAAVVTEAMPDVVLHLAGISFVPAALADPGHAFEVNVVGTVRVLAELSRLRVAGAADPVVLVVGSAEQYGRHDAAEMPLAETAELRPATQYAASKLAQEVAAFQAFRSDGLRVMCTRSFNHSGVGHGAHFLLPSIVGRALALPSSGGVLQVGNGDTIRDFLHVEDAVAAYLALLERGTAGEAYNVCSGAGLSVRTLAEHVLQRLGVSADIASMPDLKRANDVPVLVGDNTKVRSATGWAPRRSANDIIDDLIHASTR
jgi:GDP-4-dehydro-6-deoxy-D-mannose reductase